MGILIIVAIACTVGGACVGFVLSGILLGSDDPSPEARWREDNAQMRQMQEWRRRHEDYLSQKNGRD
jgi:hypothetical protein